MSYYSNKVEQSLPDWVKSGWVTEGNAAKIRHSVSVEDDGMHRKTHLLLLILAIALLVGAVFTFLAANWEGVARIVRLAIITLAILTSLAVAAFAKTQKRILVGEIAAFLAVCAFGAGIVLIGQMYHLTGEWSQAVLTWLIAAALIASVLPSPTALSFAFGLLLFWTFLRDINYANIPIFLSPLNIYFLPIWLVFSAFSYHQRWLIPLRVAIVVLCLWLAMTALFIGTTYIY